MDLHSEVVILGGGVAGGAAAIALGRSGRRVTLLEREPVAKHKVCGEFLSGEALIDLRRLGMDVANLGAVPIRSVRLAAGRTAAESKLPFAAASITRKRLDGALRCAAEKAGVEVLQGQSVEQLHRDARGSWRVSLSSGGAVQASTVFLATGKSDLRGYGRPRNAKTRLAFKMYYKLTREQAAGLRGCVELFLFPGGYCGLQPVEDGLANLCSVVEQDCLPAAGDRWHALLMRMRSHCPSLADRLRGASPQLDKPLAMAHIPYGYLRRSTQEGLYCIGDQAAVIPSFTGEGMSLALHTARQAVSAYLLGRPAPVFQRELRSTLLVQMRTAQVAAEAMNNALARLALPRILRHWPGIMSLTASRTRINRAPDCSEHPDQFAQADSPFEPG